jgi:hypothetical protein
MRVRFHHLRGRERFLLAAAIFFGSTSVLLSGTLLLFRRQIVLAGPGGTTMLPFHRSGFGVARCTPVGTHHARVSPDIGTGGYCYPEYLRSSSLNPTGPAIVLPIWMPLLLSVALATPVALRLALAPTPGVCRACGYDLSGITGACPECGNAEQEREA